MIQPKRITRYDRNHPELELFLVFSVLVANKESERIADIVNKMFSISHDSKFNDLVKQESPLTYDVGGGLRIHSPMSFIHCLIEHYCLHQWLKYWGTGQYNRISNCLKECTEKFLDPIGKGTNLKVVSVEELERIHGIGPKTARFFVVHSQQNAQHAVLDTHIMKYMGSKYGHYFKTRLGAITPSNPCIYKLIETLFLGEAAKQGMSPAELDLFIWKYYKGKEVVKNELSV